MGHLLYGYRRNEAGIVVHRLFDSDEFPPGWQDSPEKVIQAEQAAKAPPAAARGDEAVARPRGVCPKCGEHIGRGLAFHVKRCSA